MDASKIISYGKKFLKQLDKLPIDLQYKLLDRLEMFKKDAFHPILNNHSVHAVYPECRSINITGDYRAIFHEDGDKVTFIAVGTHAQLYG